MNNTLQDIMGLLNHRMTKVPTDKDYMVIAGHATRGVLTPQPKLQPSVITLGSLKDYILGNISIPTLQQVTEQGGETEFPITINANSFFGALTANSFNTAITANGGNTGLGATGGVTAIVANGVVNGIEAYGQTAISAIGTDVGIFAYGSNRVAGIFNIEVSNTSNIAEFKKQSINQAYVTHNGTIVGNRLLVNTTVDNGVDKLQVNGSIFTKGIFSDTSGTGGTTNIAIIAISNLGRSISAQSYNSAETIYALNSSNGLGINSFSLSGKSAIFETGDFNINNIVEFKNETAIKAYVKYDGTIVSNGGFLPPSLTTTQINAIVSPAVGLVVYNTTLNVLCYRDNVGWKKVTSTVM